MVDPDTLLGGKYVIVRPLGSGGMGEVYEAIQKDLSRPVAIKLLRVEVASDPAMFLRFRREAEAAASLGHPNIVQVLDFRNEPGEPPMLVMEKLEGRSLRDLLADPGPLAPARAVFIAVQILSALAAAHDANIVHRDVKPANVFILKTLAVRDFVKVLDFGIAKFLDPGARGLTDLGQIVGTVSYMAPEQARGLPVDGRADVFAVGAILFQAISGKRPRTLGPAGIFEAGTMPCLKLHDVAPFVDPRLAAVVDRALALDRNERFPTARAMATALAPFAPQQISDLERTEPTRPTAQEPAAARSEEVPSTATAPSFAHAETQLAAPALMAPLPVSGPLIGSVPPTRLSRGSVTDPPPAPAPPAQGPPAAGGHVRRSSLPSAYPRAVPPQRSPRWSVWFLAGPALVLAALFFVIVAIVVLSSSRSDDAERGLLTLVPPPCVAPAACSGRTTTSATDGEYGFCAPGSANRYRAGSVVFLARTSRSRAVVVVGPSGEGGLRIKTATGIESVVEPKAIRGAYCVP